MMLGFLLARVGVRTLVLEKHADFLRDFRGDTIHPSTLEIFAELGLQDELLALPHQKTYHLTAQFGETRVRVADFSRLPLRSPFVAFMPQWDFLDFLARQGARHPCFALRMGATVVGLCEEGGRIVGARVHSAEDDYEVRADLVIGADGRDSRVRAAAGLAVETLGAPMDVLWFRLPRADGDPVDPVARFAPGCIYIMINRASHWQCGYVIAKGALADVRSAGLPAFRARVAALAPLVANRVDTLVSWDDIKLLSVAVDRLPRWYMPGLLCIGDAAHAMSPIGGVGINLAIQDAVATANRLAGGLRNGTAAIADLAAVQARRDWPTRVTQGLQLAMQRRVISNVLNETDEFAPPLAMRVLGAVPWLQGLTARLIGIGVRPETVLTPPV